MLTKIRYWPTPTLNGQSVTVNPILFFILSSINAFYEAGLFGDLLKSIEESLVSSIRKDARLFTDLEDFLSEFNQIEDVRLDNYKNLFLGGLFFLFFLLIVSLLDRFKNKIKKFILKYFRRTREWVRKLIKTIFNALFTQR